MRDFKPYPILPPLSPTFRMQMWVINRRGLTVLAAASIILIFLATSTFFFHSPSSSVIHTDRHKVIPSTSQHSFAGSHPAEIPLGNSLGSDSPQSSSPNQSSGWTFETARDQKNYGLSDEQCDIAFPDFYHEIDRAVDHRKQKRLGNIKIEDVDISWKDKGEILRLLVHDKQLYIVDAIWADHGWDFPRALALLHSIHRAIIAYPGEIPNVEFAICLSDWPGDADHKWPLWVLTRHEKDTEKWVMPDFGYWSWPGQYMGEYSKLRREISANEPAWDKKIPQAVWRGATVTNKLREVLVEKSKGKAWADVHEIIWKEADTLEKYGLTIPEHCNYQFVLHTEGHSYSGRGKYLLNCESVSIVHTPEWKEPHTHLFVSDGPNQNMVSVQRDWKDLDKKMTQLLRNPTKAQQIAKNSAAIFRDRYLTPAAQACYWRRLIRSWSEISFTPQLFEEVANKDGTTKKVIRGQDFESFVSDLVPSKPVDASASSSASKSAVPTAT